MDIEEQIEQLMEAYGDIRSSQKRGQWTEIDGREDVLLRAAITLEKLYAVYLAAEKVLPIDVILVSDANYMERLEQAVAAVKETEDDTVLRR